MRDLGVLEGLGVFKEIKGPGMCWDRPEGTGGRGTQSRAARWLTDAAAAGGVQQEAVRAHARVPPVSVGTLPMLAAPASRALVHICGEGQRS